jgi:hypothetical protein
MIWGSAQSKGNTMKPHSHSCLKTAFLTMTGLSIAGCATNAGNGALIGAGAGAAAGALLSRGHPGATLFGAAVGAVTGTIVGAEVDRAQAYRDNYYYGGHYYYVAPPPPPPGVYETRTVYRNPDGSTTTYIERSQPQ